MSDQQNWPSQEGAAGFYVAPEHITEQFRLYEIDDETRRLRNAYKRCVRAGVEPTPEMRAAQAAYGRQRWRQLRPEQRAEHTRKTLAKRAALGLNGHGQYVGGRPPLDPRFAPFFAEKERAARAHMQRPTRFDLSDDEARELADLVDTQKRDLRGQAPWLMSLDVMTEEVQGSDRVRSSPVAVVHFDRADDRWPYEAARHVGRRIRVHAA
jgi:hypothetical protein